MTLLHHAAKLAGKLDSTLQSSQYHGELGNQIANFETLSTLVLLNFIT